MISAPGEKKENSDVIENGRKDSAYSYKEISNI